MSRRDKLRNMKMMLRLWEEEILQHVLDVAKKQSPAIPSCRNESSNSCLVVLDKLTKFSTNQRPASSQHVGYAAKWGIKSIAAYSLT